MNLDSYHELDKGDEDRPRRAQVTFADQSKKTEGPLLKFSNRLFDLEAFTGGFLFFKVKEPLTVADFGVSGQPAILGDEGKTARCVTHVVPLRHLEEEFLLRAEGSGSGGVWVYNFLCAMSAHEKDEEISRFLAKRPEIGAVRQQLVCISALLQRIQIRQEESLSVQGIRDPMTQQVKRRQLFVEAQATFDKELPALLQEAVNELNAQIEQMAHICNSAAGGRLMHLLESGSVPPGRDIKKSYEGDRAKDEEYLDDFRKQIEDMERRYLQQARMFEKKLFHAALTEWNQFVATESMGLSILAEALMDVLVEEV